MELFYYNGGRVCENCIGYYFTYPDCGRVFNFDDYENCDTGNYFWSDCATNN